MSVDIFSYLRDNSPKEFCFLDIGAKKGKWLVPFVENFHNTTFHCFEPLPESFEGLKSRYKHFPNVNCHNFVISDKDNELVCFYKDLTRPGWSSLKQHEYMTEYEELKICSRTIDSFDLSPYFIKIDVEGAELQVLQGSTYSLKYTEIIYFECNEVHYKNFGYSADDLYLFLSDYNIFVENNKPLDLDEFKYLTADQRRYENPKGYTVNFIAVKKK